MIVNSLIRYGNISPENLAKLNEWFTSALTQVADGNGQVLVSASGASQSFSYANNMTTYDWLQALDTALRLIDAGFSRMPKTVYKRF